MGNWSFVVGLCGWFSVGAIAADPSVVRHWIDQQQAQSRQKQFDSSRRREQQQQLNQERFRAEQGSGCTRQQAPWEERRREDRCARSSAAQ
jgi:hypothetical protein